ncbi:MAG: hypothetical protein JRE64_01095 [Deltaproteobacteria bacterium]|nr:hypothetical protein [Deltaproteobacteria bacterium]
MTPKQFVDLYNKVSRIEFEARLAGSDNNVIGLFQATVGHDPNPRVELHRTGQLAKPGGIPYVNCKRAKHKKNIIYKGNILRFFKKSKIKGVKHTGLAANVTSHPFTGFSPAYFMYSFCGHGCPDMLLAMNQFITYYVNYTHFIKPESGMLPHPKKIRDVVKEKLGSDCVGFVGNFLKCNYIKHRQIRPAYMYPPNFSFASRPLVKLSAVRPYAIVVNKDTKHVAIIDRILPQRTSKVLDVQLCEAYSKFLGCRRAKIFKRNPQGGSSVFQIISPRKIDVRIYNLQPMSKRLRTGSSTCACGIKWLKSHPLSYP